MNNLFVVYDLRETYHELGIYEFKVVLNPKLFKNGHDSVVKMVDSDGRIMDFEVHKWGRKLNFKFTVDQDVSDGVSMVNIYVTDKKGKDHFERLTFWIIKP